MKTNSNTNTQSMAHCVSAMRKEGYTDFIKTNNGLCSSSNGRFYPEKDTRVVSRWVFDQGNHTNSSAINVIEATDGTKGIYVERNTITN